MLSKTCDLLVIALLPVLSERRTLTSASDAAPWRPLIGKSILTIIPEERRGEEDEVLSTQAEGGSRREFAGLGLGLSLVHYFIEAHGGTVTAESDGEGQGATFRILLPAAPVA